MAPVRDYANRQTEISDDTHIGNEKQAYVVEWNGRRMSEFRMKINHRKRIIAENCAKWVE